MTRKTKTSKSAKVTKKDIFETALAIRTKFGEQPDEFILEQTKTSVRMIVVSQESAEEALPFIQETLNEQQCKAPVEILVRLKTLTAESSSPEVPANGEDAEQPAEKAESKLSEGLLAYLSQAAIPGDKFIEVSVHLTEPMTEGEVNNLLIALIGSGGARVSDVRTVVSSGSWVIRVKRGLIRRLNQADFITKVNRYYGEAEAYSANSAG